MERLGNELASCGTNTTIQIKFLYTKKKLKKSTVGICQIIPVLHLPDDTCDVFLVLIIMCQLQ